MCLCVVCGMWVTGQKATSDLCRPTLTCVCVWFVVCEWQVKKRRLIFAVLSWHVFVCGWWYVSDRSKSGVWSLKSYPDMCLCVVGGMWVTGQKAASDLCRHEALFAERYCHITKRLFNLFYFKYHSPEILCWNWLIGVHHCHCLECGSKNVFSQPIWPWHQFAKAQERHNLLHTYTALR